MTESSAVSRKLNKIEGWSLCLIGAWMLGIFLALYRIVIFCVDQSREPLEISLWAVAAVILALVGLRLIVRIGSGLLTDSPQSRQALWICYTVCFVWYCSAFVGAIATAGHWVTDLLVMALVLHLGFVVLELPFRLFEELERKRESFTLTGFISVAAVQHAVAFALDLMLYGAVFAILSAHCAYWWVFATLVYFVRGVVWQSLQAGVLQFYGADTEKLESLPPRLAALLERSGIKGARLFQYDAKHRKGYSDGVCYSIGPIYTIGLHKELLDRQVSDEIEWVFAHELGHAVAQDLVKREAVSALMIGVGLWFCSLFMLQGQEGWSYLENIQNLPVLLLVTNLSQFSLQWLEKYCIRCRERRADLFALELTGNARGMLGFCQFHMSRLRAPSRSAGWILRVFEQLGHTHPSLEERFYTAWQWGLDVQCSQLKGN